METAMAVIGVVGIVAMYVMLAVTVAHGVLACCILWKADKLARRG